MGNGEWAKGVEDAGKAIDKEREKKVLKNGERKI